MTFFTGFRIFFPFFFLALSASAALAETKPEELGKFGHWTTYRMQENGRPVCYMSLVSRQQHDKKPKEKRGDRILMITHRPADGGTDVVSYTAGIKFKPASEANVSVGKEVFNLFTQGDTAWSRDASTDHALAAAIRRENSISITGVSTHGTQFSDALDIRGAFDAYVAINKACGLPVPEKPKQKFKTSTKTTSGKSGKKTK